MSTIVNLLLAIALQILGVQAQEKANEKQLAIKQQTIQVVKGTTAIDSQSIYCMEVCTNHPSKNEQTINENSNK